MKEPSQGRAIALVSSTTPQRKAIARVMSAIRASSGMTYDDMFLAAGGISLGRAAEDERNLSKGKLAHKKIAVFYEWIVANYLPLGCEIAPEVFDPSLLTRWTDFVREHGQYDRLTFRFTASFGLTQRSHHARISDQPIPMGKPYVFDLDCGVEGALLALEATGGKTYPFSLHHDELSLLLDLSKGHHTLPVKADGNIDPLMETDDKGLRCYSFIVAPAAVMQTVIQGLYPARPISGDKLDQIALAFKDINATPFELHRLNVVFTG